MNIIKNILITTSSFDVEKNLSVLKMKNKNFQFILNPLKRKLSAIEVCDLFDKYQPIGMIAGVESLGFDQLKIAKSLKVVSRCGAGLDTVDLVAAQRLGISVFNTPDAPAPSVAELALGLILSCLRKIPQADQTIRNGSWGAIKGNLLSDKTVGIVGFGRIGKLLAHLLIGFNVRLIIFDPLIKQADEIPGLLVSNLSELFASSDIISLHLPYSSSTHHLVGENLLKIMKKQAILINVSRGGLVNEEHLYQALLRNSFFSAGLDVFEDEPYRGRLKDLPNIVMTCHMGSAAQETRQLMEDEAARNLLIGLQSAGRLI
jgi:D-3-phosphoglycerate dehydrogenase